MRVLEGKIGKPYVVHKIVLPLEVERRLEILGMTEGSRIIIINKKGSAIILKVRGTRLAIGHNIAVGIWIGSDAK